jgi:energy-coupling factor transporter transmembrane protein EcfT
VLVGLGVALAPAGLPLFLLALGAALAGIALSRSVGEGLSAPVAANLALFALVAFVLNAVFTSGTPLVVAGRSLPITEEGLRVGGETALRLMALVLLFRGVVRSIVPLEIVGAVERGFRPLGGLGLRSERLAVVLMIAIQVAPSFATEARRLSLQRALRRGWPGPGADPAERKRRLRMRLHHLPAVLVPLVGLALRRAEELAWALPARYFGAQERTPAPATAWAAKEWGAVAMAASFLALSLWVRGAA